MKMDLPRIPDHRSIQMNLNPQASLQLEFGVNLRLSLQILVIQFQAIFMVTTNSQKLISQLSLFFKILGMM